MEDKKPILFLKGSLVGSTPDETDALKNFVPLDYIMNRIVSMRVKIGIANRVLILTSSVGSGKSTAFPAALYKQFIGQQGRRGSIVCTQPRIITAIKNAWETKQSTPELNRLFKMGENIGYATKDNKLKPRTYGLTFTTLGTLTSQLLFIADEDFCNMYQFILIDEAHERSIELDLTLYLLKEFLNRNENNPLSPIIILMSATIDPTPFLNYFNLQSTSHIGVIGHAYYTEDHWDWFKKIKSTDVVSKTTISNYYDTTASLIYYIITHDNYLDGDRNDILVFVMGAAEIESMKRSLDKINQKLISFGENPAIIIELSSTIHRASTIVGENSALARLNMPINAISVNIKGTKYIASRRIIITTNISETGLTLHTLRYVIDSGFSRNQVYDPVHNFTCLVSTFAQKSRIIQRRGRVGRKFDGVFYPLYSRQVYDYLPDQQYPDIVATDITPYMLPIIISNLKSTSLRMERPHAFDDRQFTLLTKIPPDAMRRALQALHMLGYIGNESIIYPEFYDNLSPRLAEIKMEPNVGLTRLGLLASTLLISPSFTRLILSGFFWGASIMDIIAIIAYLMGTDIKSNNLNWDFIYSESRINPYNTAHMLKLVLLDEFIDGIFLYNAIINYISVGGSSISRFELFCKEANLNIDVAYTFLRDRDALIETLLSNKINLMVHESNKLGRKNFMDAIMRLKYCIYESYLCNIAQKTPDMNYITTNFIKLPPPKIIARTLDTITTEKKIGIEVSNMPHLFVYNKISFKSKRIKVGGLVTQHSTKPAMYNYEPQCDKISVMDGFIAVDFSHINPVHDLEQLIEHC